MDTAIAAFAAALVDLAGLIVSVYTAKQSGQTIGELTQQKADSDATAKSAADRATVDQGVNAMPAGDIASELQNTWTTE